MGAFCNDTWIHSRQEMRCFGIKLQTEIFLRRPSRDQEKTSDELFFRTYLRISALLLRRNTQENVSALKKHEQYRHVQNWLYKWRQNTNISSASRLLMMNPIGWICSVNLKGTAAGASSAYCLTVLEVKIKDCFFFSSRHKMTFLPGFYLDACAWPGPAGPPAGCAPWRSSGRPPCWAAAGGGGSPPSPGRRDPAWSTAGGQGTSAPDPKTDRVGLWEM